MEAVNLLLGLIMKSAFKTGSETSLFNGPFADYPIIEEPGEMYPLLRR
jgi:hypothetical protein